MAGMNRQFDSRGVTNAEPSEENPLPPWVHKKKKRPVDLEALISEIKLSPWATEEEFQEVRTWVNNKGMNCPVNHSDREGPMLRRRW